MTKIYSLYHYDNGNKKYFYVGRSSLDLSLRYKAHVRNVSDTKNHKEDVYCYIRTQCAAGIFEIEELAEVDDKELLITEDFFVITLIQAGCELQNMKKGDARNAVLHNEAMSYTANKLSFSSVKEYGDYREGERSRLLRERVLREEQDMVVDGDGNRMTDMEWRIKQAEQSKARAARDKKRSGAASIREYQHTEWLAKMHHLFADGRDSGMTDEEALNYANTNRSK